MFVNKVAKFIPGTYFNFAHAVGKKSYFGGLGNLGNIDVC